MSRDTCYTCGSDWLYSGVTVCWLCEGCHQDMKTAAINYHTLQDKAYELIRKGRLKDALCNLQLVILLRSRAAEKFFKTMNHGHHYFTYTFLPSLIKLLSATTTQHCVVWEQQFAALSCDAKTDF